MAYFTGQGNDIAAGEETQENGTVEPEQERPLSRTGDPAAGAASTTWRQHLNEQILAPVFQVVKATVPAETFRTFRVRTMQDLELAV